MKKTTFEVLKTNFQFLLTDYNFKLIKENKSELFLSYKSKLVAIRVKFDIRQGYLSIMVYKLEDGLLLENPIIILPESKLYGFNFDDILDGINKDLIILPIYLQNENDSKYRKSENGLEEYILDVSLNFKKYSKPILCGDFKLFQHANNNVKNRVLGIN